MRLLQRRLHTKPLVPVLLRSADRVPQCPRHPPPVMRLSPQQQRSEAGALSNSPRGSCRRLRRRMPGLTRGRGRGRRPTAPTVALCNSRSHNRAPAVPRRPAGPANRSTLQHSRPRIAEHRTSPLHRASTDISLARVRVWPLTSLTISSDDSPRWRRQPPQHLLPPLLLLLPAPVMRAVCRDSYQGPTPDHCRLRTWQRAPMPVGRASSVRRTRVIAAATLTDSSAARRPRLQRLSSNSNRSKAQQSSPAADRSSLIRPEEPPIGPHRRAIVQARRPSVAPPAPGPAALPPRPRPLRLRQSRAELCLALQDPRAHLLGDRWVLVA
jgi:hypothetical protein